MVTGSKYVRSRHEVPLPPFINTELHLLSVFICLEKVALLRFSSLFAFTGSVLF